MREYLFKAKRVDNGEDVEGSLIYGNKTDPNDRTKTIECVYICWAFYESVKCYTEVLPETVGQFTGLTDKNNKKVFVGDVLKTNEGYIYSVCFENCSYKIIYKGKEIIKPTQYAFDYMQVEVVNNIHDNPELLEVEE